MSKEFIPINSVQIQREPLKNNYDKEVQLRLGQWSNILHDARKEYDEPTAIQMTNIACGRNNPQQVDYSSMRYMHKNPLETYIETLPDVEMLAMKSPDYVFKQAVKIASRRAYELDTFTQELSSQNTDTTGNNRNPGQK